jgi:hypothetical protein
VGADPDAGLPGDRLEGHLLAARRERGACGVDEERTVARCIGARCA